MALTPEEIRFFETGDASSLKADPPAPAPAPAPVVDPLTLSGISGGVEPPAPAPVATPPAPVAAPAATPPVEGQVAEVLRRSLAEAQQQLADLQAQQRQLMQRQAPPAAPAPDPAVDPLGAFNHKIDTLQKQIETLVASQQQTTEQQEQQARFNAFQNQVRELRDNFVKTTPDFPDAYNYLRDTRAADLKAMGLNDQQVSETLFREEITLSQNAIRNARNPAEVAYEAAKRHGYKPVAAPAPGAPPASPLAGPDAAAIQRAQAAARNLPAATPAGGDVALTMEGLRAASDADLNKIVMNDAEWKRFTGAGQYPL
jgi:hypothetical protein